jgi:outer membrane protein assembly factor BamB
MKGNKLLISILKLVLILVPALFIVSCGKDDNTNPDNSKTPVWKYDTGEDPYESTPCISGNKVIVCTIADDNDPVSQPGTHCIDGNSGTRIWKVNDGVTNMVTSPLVYNNLIIEGGYNPHARRLSDGGIEWTYQDDLIPYSIYSNPLITSDAVYFASTISMLKLNVLNGGIIWESEGIYNNLRSVQPVVQNGRIYYADAALMNVTSFYEDSGTIDWTKSFGAAFANKPVVSDDEFFVGLQTSTSGVQTLQCLNLADQSLKWGVELGTIFSDLTLVNGKIYVVGMTTLHCRSAVDGSEIWHYDLSAGSVCEPLVTGNKVIVGFGNGLLCLDASNGNLIWEYHSENDNGFSTPVLDGDRIYVSSDDGNVYCFDIN